MHKTYTPIIFATFCLAIGFSHVSVVAAATATPSARVSTRSAQLKASPSPSPAPSPSPTPASSAAKETTLNLKERLQKILGDSDAQAQQRTLAGYIGEVTRVSEEAITLKTLTSSEIIPIDTDTKILKRNAPIPLKEVSVGNWVIVIGPREKNLAIKPELLLVQTTSLKPKEHMVAIGTIQGVTRTTVTMLPRGKSDPVTLTLTKTSKQIDADGEKIDPGKLPTDITAVVVGYASDSGWDVSTIKTMMRMAELKNASPTPTPKATAKTTPRPSVSPRPSASPRPTATPKPTATTTPTAKP
jgi:hypothetical protein